MDLLHFFSSIFLNFYISTLSQFLPFFSKKIPTLFSFTNMKGLDYILFPQLFFTIERIHSNIISISLDIIKIMKIK
jgi:hypothetical protein